MLFRTMNTDFVREKLSKTRKPGKTWKAFPHARLHLDAQSCIAVAGGTVYASPDNVGRTIGKGAKLMIRTYSDAETMKQDGVKEILIPASRVPNRVLTISAVRQVEVFSTRDQDLLSRHFEWRGFTSVPIMLASRAKKTVDDYSAAQSVEPGKTHLVNTTKLFDAIRKGNCDEQARLIGKLALNCFD